MTNVLIVIGSARKGRVADAVNELVQAELTQRANIQTQIADLKELNIPFFDGELLPSQDGYEITEPAAKQWQELVTSADKIIFITSENNHSMSAIQKNAIDWLYTEWDKKVVSATGYGWSGGSLAIENFDRVMGNLKADVRTPAKLAFMKELNPDGSVLDQTTTSEQISAQVDALLA